MNADNPHHFRSLSQDLFQLGESGMRDFSQFARPSLPEPDKRRLADIQAEVYAEGRIHRNTQPHRKSP